MNQPPISEPTPPKSSSKRNLLIVLIVFLGLGVAGYALLPDVGCLSEPYTCFKFGNFAGGQQRDKGRSKSIIKTYGKFEPQTTKYGIRWFPTYVHFGPDGDTLLVSLCHVQTSRDRFCRIGKYSISKNHWDILPFDGNSTYMEPVFSPDGQWIVTTMASTTEGIGDARTLRLVKMRPDGTGVQDLISAGVEKPAMNELLVPYQRIQPGQDIQATGASFSQNGKRLIYWRQFNLREKDAPAFAVLYTMEWETGKEILLAGRDPGFDRYNGRPFLTPDGERFVFSASFRYGLGSEEKEFVRKNSFFAANIKDAPITKGELLQKLQALPVIQQYNTNMLDMDRQGRVLYQGKLSKKKEEGNPVALSIRLHLNEHREMLALYEEEKNHKVPLTDEQYRQGAGLRRFFVKSLLDSQFQQGGGAALFLQKPQSDAQDEAVFDLHGGINNDAASLSPDGKTLAFIWGVSVGANGIGLLRHGDPMHKVRFIDWPKLDLMPAQPNSPKKP